MYFSGRPAHSEAVSDFLKGCVLQNGQKMQYLHFSDAYNVVDRDLKLDGLLQKLVLMTLAPLWTPQYYIKDSTGPIVSS